LKQKPGTAGCISEDGSGGACQASQTVGLAKLALSPDGKSLYTASTTSAAIGVFDRDPATGALTQKPGAAGCISSSQVGSCGKGRALRSAQQVAVSPNGTSVYVTDSFTDSVAVFDRDPATGALEQPMGPQGCIAESPKADHCAMGKALGDSIGIAISPDSKNVYVASSSSGAVAVLKRSKGQRVH